MCIGSTYIKYASLPWFPPDVLRLWLPKFPASLAEMIANKNEPCILFAAFEKKRSAFQNRMKIEDIGSNKFFKRSFAEMFN